MRNQLLIKCKGLIFILEKTKTSTKNNLKHIYIIKNRLSTFILSKKYTKLDV